MHRFRNTLTLTLKEFRSLLSDAVMMGLIIVIFTVAVIAIAKGISIEVRNASVAIVDEDHSVFSRRLADSLQAPYFQPPQHLPSLKAAQQAMDKGDYIFVLVLPPQLEKDLLRGAKPEIQVIADATALSQAGIGFGYLQHIIQREALALLGQGDMTDLLPLQPHLNITFNPNTDSSWFLALANVSTFVFMLAMLLVGAAVIRERERGTIEHLLVMPVSANEIAAAKIIANGTVIALATLASVQFIVKGVLNVDLSGSMALFALGTVVFLFSAAALGILLAIAAPSMPQFALLMLPIYIVLRIISGGETPLASMPDWLQNISQASPMTQYVSFSNAVLFRNAPLHLVQKELLIMGGIGLAFLLIALLRFRSMLDKQG